MKPNTPYLSAIRWSLLMVLSIDMPASAETIRLVIATR